jgi:hypothetical protein
MESLAPLYRDLQPAPQLVLPFPDTIGKYVNVLLKYKPGGGAAAIGAPIVAPERLLAKLPGSVAKAL